MIITHVERLGSDVEGTMRRPILKELLRRFVQEFEAKFPQFKRSKEQFDDPLWRWRLGPDLTFFVSLRPFDDHDEFAVDVAWSDNGRFPWDHLGELSDTEQPKCRGPLSRLWARTGLEAVWDIEPQQSDEEFWARIDASERGEDVPPWPPRSPVEEILPRVSPLVEDAMEKLSRYGMPLFRRVARKRGIAWPSPGHPRSA